MVVRLGFLNVLLHTHGKVDNDYQIWSHYGWYEDVFLVTI